VSDYDANFSALLYSLYTSGSWYGRGYNPSHPGPTNSTVPSGPGSAQTLPPVRTPHLGGSFARTGLPSALTSATYDDANQIATWQGLPFTYDANGNLTNDGSMTFGWDSRDHLTSVSGTVGATFSYDDLPGFFGPVVTGERRQLRGPGFSVH
jgi:hypothetical protein